MYELIANVLKNYKIKDKMEYNCMLSLVNICAIHDMHYII